ncbi:MAG: hypothetical protein OXT64_08010 [Gammaproteobacteria bacterium]|nr:hypothetical protein [Gammaproteobacteria bacterium]MDE0453207.1 hypothetical protein [Gammaproteobacteria bacterium]
MRTPTTSGGQGERPRTLFITSDDRTGALEIAGTVANARFSVLCGPHADDDACCVVDIASRHLTPEAAQRQAAAAHARDAHFRSHKIDSGLRGNWPFEVRGLLQLGHGVAVVPSFPDAGRRCVDGVVYVDGVPVLESPFGKDPLTAPLSSRPLEILEATDCADGDVVVWDASDNTELEAAAQRCREEGRAIVGPSGAVAAYAATVFPDLVPREVPIEPPVLVLCGSLNAMSREQIARLGVPVLTLSDETQLTRAGAAHGAITVVATPVPSGAISNREAERMAMAMAGYARRALESGYASGTLFVLGGDTAAAIIGDETLDVLGTVDTAVPISRFRDGYLVTKGGGIGRPDTLVKLLSTVRG